MFIPIMENLKIFVELVRRGPDDDDNFEGNF